MFVSLLVLFACIVPGGEAPKIDKDHDGFSPPDDCNDNDPEMNPGAIEICDGIDNNCDARVDAGAVDAPTWCPDKDGDGFGSAATSTSSCEPYGTLVEDCTDCNDDNAETHPGADEFCDDHDNDCDSLVDTDDDDLVDGRTFYQDLDGDGWGDPTQTQQDCSASNGWVTQSGDCDDADGAIHPNAVETCNGLDDDCDAATPDAQIATVDGLGTWPTLALAISNAAAGDTVVICPGTYAERISINKDLSLVSLGGSAETTLTNGHAATGLNIGAGAVSVTGLTIADCGTESSTAGGINASDAASLTLTDVVVRDNQGRTAGGIYAPRSGAFTATDTVVADNLFESEGGGIILAGGSFSGLEVSGNFSPNTGDFTVGGGLLVTGGGEAPALVDCSGGCEIHDNSAFGGGGIFAVGSVELRGGVISANYASYGGGIWVKEGALTLTETWIEGNLAEAYGGGLAAVSADTNLSGVTLTGNEAYMAGGGAYLYYADAVVSGGAVTANTVDQVDVLTGGGFALDSGSTLGLDGVDLGSGTADNAPSDVALRGPDVSYNAYGAGTVATCSVEAGYCI